MKTAHYAARSLTVDRGELGKHDCYEWSRLWRPANDFRTSTIRSSMRDGLTPDLAAERAGAAAICVCAGQTPQARGRSAGWVGTCGRLGPSLLPTHCRVARVLPNRQDTAPTPPHPTLPIEWPAWRAAGALEAIF